MAARETNQLAISSVSFWEIALLIVKQRLDLALPPAELRRQLLDTGVIELPMTGDIAVLAAELENLHSDPTDRFIAATAIAHDAILMTADRRLLNWRNKSMKRQNASK